MGVGVMSSYLWSALGHCILLHTKQSVCTKKKALENEGLRGRRIVAL